MVGWHHQLNEHEFEQAPGHSEGRGSLACFNLWGCKELDMTEQLNRTELNDVETLLSWQLQEIIDRIRLAFGERSY